MDPIPGFRERLDQIKRRLELASPGDGHAILVTMINHLFESQYGFQFTGSDNLVFTVFEAALVKHQGKPSQRMDDPHNYEAAVHETLFVLLILMKDPPKRVEYDSRIRMIW